MLKFTRDEDDELNGGPVKGVPLQNIRLGDDDYLFDRLGASIYLLYFSDQAELPMALNLLKDAVTRSGVPFEVVQISRKPLASQSHQVIHDPVGHMHQRYDASEGTSYLVRPDQHVSARWKQFDNGDLLTAMKRLINLS